jgi:tetratricopeptide (TPR) repeat protein
LEAVGAFENSNGGGRERASALADPPLIASGKTLGERYRLERPLGHGGMAVVWLATDERLEREVAVKVLSDNFAHDDEYLGRFRREAHTAAGLQHPNLVSVYDFEAGPRPYLVMEYVPGGDLAERVETGDAPDPESLARELLSALRHIHTAGVLHRDIKPQNVLIDASGHARLTDFGIAQPRDASALTRTGQVIGTESYIAPEVMAGEQASERSDLYALGVVLADVSREGAGATLWELTDRLRDPEPSRRPRSAAAALAALERGSGTPPTSPTQPFTPSVPADDPPPSRSVEPAPTGPRDANRRRIVVGALALGAILVALAIGLAIGSGGDDGASVDVRERNAGGGGNSGQAEEQPAEAPPAEEPAPAAEPQPAEEPASTDGAALNDEGFALVQAGQFEEAVPILEDAVGALEGSGDELTYNYALYNLGLAYLGAGRPEDAIPVLEQRLQYPDQQDVVQAKLDEAYAAAGQEPSSSGPSGEDD